MKSTVHIIILLKAENLCICLYANVPDKLLFAQCEPKKVKCNNSIGSDCSCQLDNIEWCCIKIKAWQEMTSVKFQCVDIICTALFDVLFSSDVFINMVLFLTSSDKAVWLWLLCTSFKRGAAKKIVGWNSLLDGTWAHLKTAVWTRGETPFLLSCHATLKHV